MSELDHREQLLAQVAMIPVRVPCGWSHRVLSVNDVMYVGFSSRQHNQVLCVSSSAQAVINCDNGEKIYEEACYDEDQLIAYTETLDHERIHLAGLGGGGLKTYGTQGDAVISIAPAWPKQRVVYMPNFTSCYLDPLQSSIVFDDYELRAFGFSTCGTYLVVACSSELHIFKKTKESSLSI